MYNSGFRSKTRTPDGVGTVASQVAFVQKSDPQPSITGWSIQNSDDRALDPAGGQTVVVSGAGFTSGMTVTVGTTSIGSVTIVSSTQATFTAPAKTSGNYTLTMANSNGQAAILVPGLAYSTIVTWSTAAGSLGNTYETTSFTESVLATSDSSITYTLASGSLPTNATLNSNGTITGTAAATASPTTYSFSVTATDAELQDSTQSFTITVAPDAVTWVTPSSGATITSAGTAVSQSLSATDAAGYSVTYAANTLPTGLSLSGSTISGTPTVAGNTTTLLTATAATTGRYATNTITWVVSLSDTYWPYNTLLLSANSSVQTQSFVADNSLNNAQLTVVGDTRANPANPYQAGYYSNYFDGTGDYLTTGANSGYSFGTGDFTVECWVYYPPISNTNGKMVLDVRPTSTNGAYWNLGAGNTGVMAFTTMTTGGTTISDTVARTNQWVHYAVTRQGTALKMFANGALVSSATDSSNISSSGIRIGMNAFGDVATDTYWLGYIGNVRIVKGTALYTAAFTPSTTPLLPVANTQLLTCQSNRLIDNSANNLTITKNGDTTVTSANPFTTVYQAGTQYYSTYFDGSTAYAEVVDSSNGTFNFGTGDFTVEAWAISSTNTIAQEIFNFRTGAYGLLLRIDNPNTNWELYYAGTSNTVVSQATYGSALNWTHHAVTRASGVLKWWINGVLAYTNNAETENKAYTTLTVGKYSSYYWNGCISNLRVTKGLAVYTGNFTVPTSPLQLTQSAGTNIAAISGSQVTFLGFNSSTLVPTGSITNTITNVSSVPVAVSPFTPSSYSNTAITTYGSGYFDGTGDNIVVPSSSNNALGTDFTVECWVYLTGTQTTTYGWGVMGTYDGLTNGGWEIKINRSDTAKGLVFINGNAVQATTPTYIPLNTWTHLAASRTGSSLLLFINGVQEGSATYSTAITLASQIYIGSEGAGQYFTGYISNARIVKGTALYTSNFVPQFTSPLTAVTNTQLLTLQTNGAHNNNDFKDSSSFNNLVTRSGNVTNGTFSPYGNNWSYYFPADSTNTNVNGAASSSKLIDFAGAYTLECWCFLPTALGVDAAIMCSSASTSSAGNGRYWGLNATNQFGYNNRASTALNYITINTTWPVGQWFHVAFVMNSTTTATVYLNGVSVGTGTDNTAWGDYSSYPIMVGSYTGTGDYRYKFKGYLSNLRFSNNARYTTTFTPSTTPLTADSNTTLLMANSNRFINQAGNAAYSTFSVLNNDVSVQKFSPFGTVTVPSYYSTAFNGSTDYLTVANGTPISLPTTTTPFTIEAWVYVTAFTGVSIMSSNFTSGGIPFWFGMNAGNNSTVSTGGYPILAFYSGSTWTYAVAATPANSTQLSLNTWYHIAGVFTGTQATIYVNGTQHVTAAVAAWQATAGAAGGVNIGRKWDSSSGAYFSGYISNARLVIGTALYTGNFTPSTTPLTAVANTTLLTCQNNTFIDNSTNNYAITAGSTTVKPLAVSPFTPTASDITPYSTTTFGGSMYFDGTSDVVTLPAGKLPQLGTSNFTMEAWVYTTTVGAGAAGIFDMWNGGQTSFLLRRNTADIQFYVQGGSSIGVTTMVANTWIHYAVVRNGTTITLYQNGIAIGTPISAYSTSITNTAALGIGGTATTGAECWAGYISDARIIVGTALYTSNFAPPTAPATPTVTGPYGALTTSSSTATSNLLVSGTSGGIIDATRTVDLETVADAKVTPFSPYNGSYYSNYFDGTTDGLTLSNSTAFDFGSSDFTIEFWINTTSSAQQHVFAKRANTGSYTPILVGINTNKLYILGSTSGSTWEINPTFALGTITITSGVWTHIACVRSGTTIYGFVNGALDQTWTSISGALMTNATAMTVGCGSTALDNSVNGKVSNFRLVKGTALYTSTFTPPTSPLTAISGTNVLTCQSNKFVENSTNAYTVAVSGSVAVQTQNPFQVNTGQSYYFDGTGDYLLITQNTNFTLGTGDFTIECWAYFNSISSGGELIDFRPTSTNGVYPTLYVETTGVLYYYVSSANRITGATIAPGQWYHIALARSSGVTKLFVNGTQSGSNYTDTNSYIVGASRPVIGSNSFTLGTYPMNGYITDLRITNGVARYTTTFTPPTSPDLLY